MIAIGAGLGTAFVWAAAALCAAQASRVIGPWSTVAWIMVVGLAVTVPALALDAPSFSLTPARFGLMAVAGVGNVAGLAIEYMALQLGKKGVVTAIVSTEGAVAAAVAVLAGERLHALTLWALVAIVVGVIVTALAQDRETVDDSVRDPRVAIWLAVVVAAMFGASLYCSGRLGQQLPILVAVLPARVTGTLMVAVPLGAFGRLRLARTAIPWLVLAGLAEVTGIALIAIGSRHGLAITAVLGSLFPVVVSGIAYVFLHEALGKMQVAGVMIIVVGAAVVAAATS